MDMGLNNKTALVTGSTKGLVNFNIIAKDIF
jgi:hypothetical protein